MDRDEMTRELIREIEERFGEKGLRVLKELAVIDLPIKVEVAKEVYDLSPIDVDQDIVKMENGYLILDKKVKEILFENSESYHRKAIEYYSRLDESLDVMAEMAYHYVMIKDYERSFELFMRCSNSIYGKHRCVEKLIFTGEKLIGKVKDENRLLGTLGNLYMVLKKYDEAEFYYRKVKEIGALLNLANLKYVKGDYAEAEELLKECISLTDDDGIVEKALTILSYLYLDLNRFEDAEKCLMDILRIRGNRTAEVLNNLGYLYSRKGDYEKAERFYKESLRIYNDMDDLNGVATTLNNLCSIYLKMDLKKAKEILKFMDDIMERVPPDLKAKYYFLKAKTLEEEDKFSAMEYYAKAGALGFLVFRNFGINAINYMHSLDKAEEIAKTLNLKEIAGDIFVLKSAIARVYFGILNVLEDVECGERGSKLMKALKGEKASLDVKDELDSAFYVVIRDLGRLDDR